MKAFALSLLAGIVVFFVVIGCFAFATTVFVFTDTSAQDAYNLMAGLVSVVAGIVGGMATWNEVKYR